MTCTSGNSGLQASAKITRSGAFAGHPSLNVNVSTPKLICFFDPHHAGPLERLSARALTTLPIDLVPEPAQYDTTKSIYTRSRTTDTGHVASGATNIDA